MVNRVPPCSHELFPWARLRAFVEKYHEVFTPGDSTEFAISITDDRAEPSDYMANIAFYNPPDESGIHVLGKLQSEAFLARLDLDLERKRGRITFPVDHSELSLDGENVHLSTPGGLLAKLKPRVDATLGQFWSVLNYIVDEEPPVKELIGKMMLANYPHRYN